MTRGCILLGAALTTTCAVRPVFFATDRPRCAKPDPSRIKPPRPVRVARPEAR